MGDSKLSFSSIVATMGVVLIAVGIAWLIAKNWHSIPSFIKILILLAAISLSFTSGIFLKIKGYRKISASLILLGSLLYTLSVFLIAQIFSTSISLQGTAFLLLLCWIGVIFSAYIFNSRLSLFIGFIEFLIWISIQYFALQKINSTPGMLVLIYLTCAIFFYGLNLIHKNKDHEFASMYFWWSILYLLIFAYIVSFQSLLPTFWPNGFVIESKIALYFTFFSVISLAVLIFGIYLTVRAKKANRLELYFIFGTLILMCLIILMSILISSTVGSCHQKYCYDIKVKDECNNAAFREMSCEWLDNNWNGYCTEKNCNNYRNESQCKNADPILNCTWQKEPYSNVSYCMGYYYEKKYDVPDFTDSCNQYNNNREGCNLLETCKWSPSVGYLIGRGNDIPFNLWALWIFDNMVFLAIILLVIGYGTKYGIEWLVNLGIIFFALDIITRYIGFIIDFQGYNSLSLLFISGGIILLLGGWAIEKWRKKLIDKARNI